MANFTEVFDSFGSYNQTGTPFTLSPFDSNDISVGFNDATGHNAQARIGYFYPIRWIESVVGMVGNFLVIIAVSRYEDLQTPTGFLLANLAGADILTASLTLLSVLSEAMTRSVQWLGFCIFKEVMYVIASYGNILSLSMLSIDRLICLTARFWYVKNVTLWLTLTCQIISWIGLVLTYSLAFTLRSTATLSMPTCVYSFLLSAEDLRLFMIYPYFFFTAITILNYIILGVIVWYQGKQTVQNFNALANHVQQRQRKLTKTTAMVVIGYLTLTIPMVFISLEVKKMTALSVHLQYIGLLFWHLNSVINPFIYAYRMPKFRKAVRQILGLHHGSNAVAPAPAIVQVGNDEHHV